MMRGPQRVFAIFSLVVAPLLLALIDLFHPAHFTMDPGMTSGASDPQAGNPYYNALHYFGPDWWFLLHMIQTPLSVRLSFGLLALTDSFSSAPASLHKPFAWIARIATVVFMTYYTVLDG